MSAEISCAQLLPTGVATTLVVGVGTGLVLGSCAVGAGAVRVGEWVGAGAGVHPASTSRAVAATSGSRRVRAEGMPPIVTDAPRSVAGTRDG
ncbi:hypothetical protein GCM10009840_19000 [Pseudolysinimonas kribbensis]|uniref:Uncharacterized protein n=1 Tax=Pseudolysinimonas kribbensis TaxID=433641 RepID=A0ABQ6JZG2_9MICO|nr:hypothetical protein GCM10025881_05290 [Pseudolysinimonas kribbensis]